MALSGQWHGWLQLDRLEQKQLEQQKPAPKCTLGAPPAPASGTASGPARAPPAPTPGTHPGPAGAPPAPTLGTHLGTHSEPVGAPLAPTLGTHSEPAGAPLAPTLGTHSEPVGAPLVPTLKLNLKLAPIYNCRVVSGLRPFNGPIRNPVKKGPGPETIYHFEAETIY